MCQVDKAEVDQIFTRVWEYVARSNPMLLVNLPETFDFTPLHDMIRECLAKGLSTAETRERAVKAFFSSATANIQLRNPLSPSNRAEGASR